MRFYNVEIYGILVLSILIMGCSRGGRNLPVEYVEGIVAMDGAPLEHASIQFVPKEEGVGIEAAGGYTDATGKYTLTSNNGDPNKGALPGEYNILVEKWTTVPVSGVNTKNTRKAEDESTEVVEKLVTPRIYMDRSKPQFEATVVKGKNTFNFDLKSKP